MGRTATALLLKFGAAWGVMLLLGMAFGPSAGKAAVIAIVLAAVSWLADRIFPFELQGITRWAIDGGLAALTIYVAQFLWPGHGVSLLGALVMGFIIGAIEIPLHFYLAVRFDDRRRQDDDGIR
ncbi:MAG: DUF2512 family protein [Mycobacterium leprae]